jgi:hypothetical protein
MDAVRMSFQLYLSVYVWTADGYASVHWRQWDVVLVRPASCPLFHWRNANLTPEDSPIIASRLTRYRGQCCNLTAFVRLMVQSRQLDMLHAVVGLRDIV